MQLSGAVHSANIHNPQRLDGESMQAYRERRAASARYALRVMTFTRDIDPRTLGKPASSTDRERARVKAERPAVPGPKFRAERKRHQHSHPLRDEHGAYTMVGRSNTVRHGAQLVGWYAGERRMWLAGISAQRGY